VGVTGFCGLSPLSGRGKLFFNVKGWAWQTFFGSIDGRGKLFLGQSKAWQTFFGSIDVDVANFFWVNR